MNPYIGDFRYGDTIEHCFPSHATDGSSITLATNGTFRSYRGGTLITGPTVTFTEDIYTGVHRVSVLLTGTGVLPFADYTLILEGAVVDGKTQNVPIMQYSIMNRGTEVVQKTTLAAVTADGGTLTDYGRVNIGDFVQTIPIDGSRPDFGIIDSFNAGTGVFVLRANWRTVPSVGFYVQVTAAPGGGIIGATDIADNAFQSSKFADGFLTAPKIAADAITSDKIADNAIGAAQIAANAITNLTLAADSIRSTHLHSTVLDEVAGKTQVDTLSTAITAAFGTLTGVVNSIPESAVVAMFDESIDGVAPITFGDLLKLMLAFVAGKSDGLTLLGGTAHFRNVPDTKDVITAVLDANGNRLSVTLNP